MVRSPARSPRKAAAAKQQRRVQFAPRTEVRVVPRGGRELDQSYQGRLDRQAGLKLHRIKINRQHMNLHFGNGDSVGSVGQYTYMMAKKDLWRKAHQGKLWYRATKKDNRLKFTPAFPSALEELLALRDMFQQLRLDNPRVTLAWS